MTRENGFLTCGIFISKGGFMKKNFYVLFIVPAIWIISSVTTTLYGGLFRFLTGGEVMGAARNPFDFYLLLKWGLITPIIWWLVQKFPFRKRSFVLPHIIHMVFSIFTSVAHEAIEYTAERLIAGAFTFGGLIDSMQVSQAGYVNLTTLLYWAVVGAAQAVSYYDRLQQKERQSAALRENLINARLEALRSNLQPHFLFNTLNSINALAVKGNMDKVRDTIEELGRMLRLSLRTAHEQLVTVEKEIEFVRIYLSIEEMRFQDRLKVHFSVSPNCYDALIPNLIIQPLVENAIIHGFADKTENGELSITIERVYDSLVLQITDNGKGMPREFDVDKSAGFGLKSVKERLALLFPDNSTFGLNKTEGGGTSVSITIPFAKGSQV